MSNIDVPSDVIDFLAKWAVNTDQDAGDCAKRFWDLMINQDISDETKSETIKKWMDEAGYS